MALTERSCRAIVCTGKSKRYADSHGLALLAHPNGRKYWVGRYKINGKEKTKSLGQYPEVSLAKARDAWALFRGKVEDKEQVPTFAQVYEKLEPARARRGYKPSITNTVYYKQLPQSFVNLPITAVNNRVVAELLTAYFDRGKTVAAFVYRVIRAVIELAVDYGYLEVNPINRVVKMLPKTVTEHHRSMPKERVGEYVAAMNKTLTARQMESSAFARLNLLTAVRANELYHARWQDIDIEAMQWTIPAEFMKMGRTHIVPLSRQAVEIFSYLRRESKGSEYVFADCTTGKSLIRGKARTYLAYIGFLDVHTTHGNRSLFATVTQEELGFDYKVADLQLAHKNKSGVAAAYDRAEFMEQRRALMQQWADWIDAQAMAYEGSVGGITHPYSHQQG